jgi:general secretion pathway protein F
LATNFYFKAVAADGKMRTGILHGDTERWVAQELRKQGLTPVYVGVTEKKGFELSIPGFGRGRRRDVLFITQELCTLLNAGIPLDRSLSITSELTERPVFRSVVSDVLRTLKGGKSLADSLATKPEYFSELYINMVRAGEASGSLAAVFERLAEFERTRDDLRSYIVSSMVYPALLTAVGVASIVFMLTFVVPRFAQVFQDSQMEMPLPTKLMFDASNFLKTYGWLVAGGLLALILVMRSYTSTDKGRMWWDTLRLRLPVLGIALRKAEVARFARAMSTLVANSVPLVQSISIAGATLNNRKIARSLSIVSQGVKRGEGISAPLRRTGEFPALASHLLAVGEETGRLDHMFARMADIYESDTRAAIKRFTALFEPVIILVMGIIVGALILSMLLAITSINEVAI